MNRILLTLMCSALLYACRDAGSSITDEHVRLDDTRIFVIPPEGFTQREDLHEAVFIGPNESSLRIYEQIRAFDTANVRIGHSPGAATAELKLLDVRRVEVNGLKGLIKEYEFREMKTILIGFGDSTITVYAVADAKANDRVCIEKLKRSIASMRYDHYYRSDPFRHTPYSLDTTHSAFKFCREKNRQPVFSLAGNYADQNNIVEFHTVNLKSRPPIADLAENLMTISTDSFADRNAIKVLTDTILDGKEIYETTANIVAERKAILVYVAAVRSNTRLVFCTGRFNTDKEHQLTETRKLFGSITFK